MKYTHSGYLIVMTITEIRRSDSIVQSLCRVIRPANVLLKVMQFFQSTLDDAVIHYTNECARLHQEIMPCIITLTIFFLSFLRDSLLSQLFILIFVPLAPKIILCLLKDMKNIFFSVQNFTQDAHNWLISLSSSQFNSSVQREHVLKGRGYWSCLQRGKRLLHFFQPNRLETHCSRGQVCRLVMLLM